MQLLIYTKLLTPSQIVSKFIISPDYKEITDSKQIQIILSCIKKASLKIVFPTECAGKIPYKFRYIAVKGTF